MAPSTVLFVVPALFGNAAIERRARLEIEALVSRGHRVRVCTQVRTADEEERRRIWSTASLVELTTITPRTGLLHGRSSIRQLRFARAVRREQQAASIPGLVVSHCAVTLAALRDVQAPKTLVIHSLVLDQLLKRANASRWPTVGLGLLAELLALRGGAYSIAVSRATLECALREGACPMRSAVLHNPVDTTRFTPRGLPRDIDVLYVGRFSREKGVEALADALPRLTSNLRVVLVGAGRHRALLEHAAKRAQCKIEFPGAVPNETLPDVMARSKVLVVPSLSDSHPVVVLEAMACGTPVVGSDVGGIPEMIRDGCNGWLVPPRQPEQLIRAINATLALAPERRATFEAAARSTAEQFSVPTFSRRAVELYERAMSGEAFHDARDHGEAR